MARCLESIDGVDLEEAHEWVRVIFYIPPSSLSLSPGPQCPCVAFLELYG